MRETGKAGTVSSYHIKIKEKLMHCSSKTKVCFILGIDQRSGTNFIYRLLKEHPNCAGPGPIWEDHFLQNSNLLREYTNTLYKSWNPQWEVEKKLGGREILMRHFGNSIEHFLKMQLNEDPVNQTAPEQSSTKQDNLKILLTKTPGVGGLDNFFDLFPDAYLILIVRDGRAVVESGVRSFDWDYEKAMLRWRNAANTILDFKEKHEKENKPFLIVKYEDVVVNQNNSLLKIFDFLGLDPELFDFDSANSLGVTGSSDLKKQTGTIHWKETEKKADFNPLERFSNWDRKKHERFCWLAEQQMMDLEYELNEIQTNKQLYIIRNTFIDLVELGSKVARKVFKG